MGRIVTRVTIDNFFDEGHSMEIDALVDTGASYLTLPMAWKGKFGKFRSENLVPLVLADQRTMSGMLCGPVEIQVEGFRAVYNEIMFLEMQPVEERYEPLLGYIVLEQCGAAVDMLGHRLLHVKYMDLK